MSCKCFQRMLRIIWPARVSSLPDDNTSVNKIGQVIKRRLDTLRGARYSDCMVDLGGYSVKKKAVGGPKNTWMRTMKDRNKIK